MPSPLIHLQTGRIYMTPDCPEYYSGLISPDGVSEREIKDHTHFRDIPASERDRALREYRSRFDMNNLYCLGVIFHLYTDMLWDMGPQKNYIDNFKGDDWFHPYREEINKASSYIYHNSEWSRPTWDAMLGCPIEKYACVPEFPPDRVKGFLERNGRWHEEHVIGPSEFFTPELVNDFCKSTARQFSEWIKK